MKNSFENVYVVASKLGTIGMGSTAYYALKGIEKNGFSYKAFCRGYDPEIKLNKKNLTNYSFLEYLSYPFRFLEKFLGFKINSFKFVNYLFGKLIFLNLPKTKIYHTWMGISPQSILKAKKQGAILILEGANSHPLTSTRIMNREYKENKMFDFLIDENKINEEFKIFKEFDYIMCPSDFVYNSFLENGFDKEKLIKVPYGVDLDKFKPKPKVKTKKIKFIFIGSIQIRKGIHYLLQAWDELNLKNAELLIAGRVWPDARKIVEKYKENKSIKFLGFAKPQEILKDCDVFISPSLEEGSALTCYEAMACGLPLITTFNTGSVIRDGREGFIVSIKDVEALKQKIKFMYDNPKICQKMGKAARKRVEKYSWENYGRNLVKEYKRILNENT